MTNTVTSLRSDTTRTHHHIAVVDQLRPTSTRTSGGDTPPTPPPPPVRARVRGMIRPVGRRRAPAVPPAVVPVVPPPLPPSTPLSADEFLDDEFDPVSQNERNDVIWKRRVDGGRAASMTAARAPVPPTQRHQRDQSRVRRPRRWPSPQPPPPPASHCRQCQRVEEETSRLQLARPPPPTNHARTSDFIDLKSVSSRADNEYVEEPSTVSDTAATSSSVPLRLSDLQAAAVMPRRVERPGVLLKSSTKDGVGTSTPLPASAPLTHDSGVTCKQCSGCRCASCQHTDLLCTGTGRTDDIQCCCGGRRPTVRTVLGACLCPCWSWTMSACRRRCNNSPRVCRCGTDEPL